MKVLVTGSSGFLGQRFIEALLARRDIPDGRGGAGPVTEILALDQGPGALRDTRVRDIQADIADAAQLRDLMTPDVVGIAHLAGVVSGTAEADFDLGMRVNLDGTRTLLEAARGLGRPIPFLFSSSLAVYGGDLPEVVDDDTRPDPQSSYGIQKLIGELLVADYTRKGYIDGRSVRIPTVSVRPGLPNGAASSFASGIIREPMAGKRAICPVDPGTPLWLAATDRAVEALVHAFLLPGGKLGKARSINLPGLTVTAGEMVDTLRELAGDAVADRIDWQPDTRIKAIVDTWPARIDTTRAQALGFAAPGTGAELVTAYVRTQAPAA
ncbi:Nucleoside-diphosphate-sugar epimerases [plant metagenome]|uniref:Nucleoside-diphosphate-sugar epimerases n=1 Tax=plant metagenome TaxID=1297885 RepID=A0A484NYG5_9ZZZZ